MNSFFTWYVYYFLFQARRAAQRASGWFPPRDEFYVRGPHSSPDCLFFSPATTCLTWSIKMIPRPLWNSSKGEYGCQIVVFTTESTKALISYDYLNIWCQVQCSQWHIAHQVCNVLILPNSLAQVRKLPSFVFGYSSANTFFYCISKMFHRDQSRTRHEEQDKSGDQQKNWKTGTEKNPALKFTSVLSHESTDGL